MSATVEFIEISNAGTLNRNFLEIIGLSPKRGKGASESIIGNKGTGTKLASIAAIRLGVGLGITSKDKEGRYFLTFETEPFDIDGTEARRVVYRYQVGREEFVRRPSNFVVESFRDWDKPIGADDMVDFKMLREFLCNAYDEDVRQGILHTDRRHTVKVVDQCVFARDGEVRVFLQASPGMRVMLWDMPERYFKFRSTHEPLSSFVGFGAIYPKSDPERTRLFHKGVLVHCDANVTLSSRFDYSVDRDELVSEERILKDLGPYRCHVASMFQRLTDLAVAKQILEAVRAGRAKFEEECFNLMLPCEPAADQVWRQAIAEVFGTRICLSSYNPANDSDAQHTYHYTVISDAPPGLQSLLRKMDVKAANEVLPRIADEDLEVIDVMKLDTESRRNFAEARRVFKRCAPARAQTEIVIFFARNEEYTAKGFTNFKDGEPEQKIWVRAPTRTTLPPLVDMLATFFHETTHVRTKDVDHDGDFVDAQDVENAIQALRRCGYRVSDEGDLIEDPQP